MKLAAVVAAPVILWPAFFVLPPWVVGIAIGAASCLALYLAARANRRLDAMEREHAATWAAIKGQLAGIDAKLDRLMAGLSK